MSGAGDDDTAAAMAAMGLPTNFASPNFGGAKAGPSRQSAPTVARPPASTSQQFDGLPTGPRAMQQDSSGGGGRGGFAPRGRGFERGGRGQGRGRGRGGPGGFHARPQDQGYGQRVAPTMPQDDLFTSGGHNKRKRGPSHGPGSDRQLLPLDQISPLIRPSFTEDPWAHLTK